ncbi:hypothetical protein ABJ851_002222 [Shigella flexneri]|nr:hypothetical protein [Escherichia coli]
MVEQKYEECLKEHQVLIEHIIKELVLKYSAMTSAEIESDNNASCVQVKSEVKYEQQ